MIRPCAAAAALVAWLGVVAARPLGAHEYWLAPSRYLGGSGDTVEVRAYAGTGFRGESKPWAAPRALRFTLRGPRELDLTRAAMNGDPVWARFVVADRSGALLAYVSSFARIELPAAEFDAYLAAEGLDGPLAARRARGGPAPGRERYARCAKSWVAGEAADAAAQARLLAPVGMPLEIVPLADPTRAAALRVRVLDRGRPLAGALVKVWRQPLDGRGRPRNAATRDSVEVAGRARTGRDGIARLAISGAGEWMMSVVHMVPCPETAEADWESRWASLSFARAAVGGAARTALRGAREGARR